MRKPSLFICLFFISGTLSLVMYSCLKDRAPIPRPKPTMCDTMKVSFSKDIQSILWTSCAISSGCHSAGATYEMYDYTTIKPFIDNGKLRNRVLEKKDMPPGGALEDSLLQKLNCWLEKGAPNN